jgi:hypothetical protein
VRQRNEAWGDVGPMISYQRKHTAPARTSSVGCSQEKTCTASSTGSSCQTSIPTTQTTSKNCCSLFTKF